MLPGGRPVAVTTGDDSTVRVWDLATGTPAGEPLTGHTDTVAAVATLLLPDGRPVAVTGSNDGTVRVWDLTSGACTHLLPLPGSIMTVDSAVVDGRPCVVVGGEGIAAFWL